MATNVNATAISSTHIPQARKVAYHRLSMPGPAVLCRTDARYHHGGLGPGQDELITDPYNSVVPVGTRFLTEVLVAQRCCCADASPSATSSASPPARTCNLVSIGTVRHELGFRFHQILRASWSPCCSRGEVRVARCALLGSLVAPFWAAR